MSAAAGSLRAAALLIRLRARQQVNHLLSVYRYRFGAGKRGGTGRKARGGWLIGGLVGVGMLIGVGNVAYQSIDNMERTARQAEIGDVGRRVAPAPRPPGAAAGRQAVQPARPAPRIAPAPGSVWTPGVLRGATFLASLAILAALFITLASREILRPEWELEWLVTLPLPLSTLIWCRIVERAFTNGGVMIVLVPIFTIMAWRCGHLWTAPLWAIGLTAPLLVLIATAHTLFDTGLRLALAPSRLRNLHAAVSIVSPLPLLVATAMGLPGNTLVYGWVDMTPDWAGWLPGGLAVRALAAADAAACAQWLALMLAEVAAATAIGFLLLRHQMRNGVIAVGPREAGRRPAVQAPPAAVRGPALLSPVQRRELRLLGRDRSFMVQTLLLPLMLVGAQLLLNAHADIFAAGVRSPANLSAVAFGLAAYTLMFSAFQTLNAEGQALWILFCVPHSLDSILRQKALLWGTAATLYALAVFAAAVAVAHDISWALVGSAVIVLVGVPIFSVIATALGVFGCDPLEQDVQKRVRVTYLYLYLLLASFYGYAIYASAFWPRVATMVLTALVALALWQKARDRFPYLLDPTAAPPASVSVADGLIAALMFFVLQALVAVLGLMVTGTAGSRTLTAPVMWVAFAAAGALTYGVMRLIYWRAETAGVPRLRGPHVGAAALWGLGGGAAAAAAGLAYSAAARAFDWFPAVREAGHPADPVTFLWIGSLAVLAAPIFEEFIFRGLIFGGLRRSLGFGAAAVASAAIFAIVHPPASVVPVFGLGLAAAFVYERTRMLAGPMIVHATYNAVVVAFQWNFMQQTV